MRKSFPAFVLLLISSTIFAQKINKQEVPWVECAGVTYVQKFKVADSVITCNTCHWDACGNIVNKNSDTLYKNTGVVYPGFRPVFLTIDSILLNKDIVQTLLVRNKIRHMKFLHCNEVAQRMGFIALEGLYFIELRDTVMTTESLVDVVSSKYKNIDIKASQILINGYQLKVDRIRFPSQAEIEILYFPKSNHYAVLTE